MKTKLAAFFFLCFVSTTLFAQEEILMTVGGVPVTKAEFERIYRKNNTNQAIDRKSLEEYLDLFINFKIKVLEAESLGFDTLSDFRSEFEGYREQLSRPYLSDQVVLDSLMREAYDRMLEDVRISHIMVAINDYNDPADTLRAYKLIHEAYDKLRNGVDFEEVLMEYSEDPDKHRTNGDLGYFTGFMLNYPVENIVYKTPVSHFAAPVNLMTSYHIIKVTDRRPARGRMKVAHILVTCPENATDDEVAKAEARINEAYSKLKAGGDFAQLALEYSDDKTTAEKGGELRWFGIRNMHPDFEDMAFSLEKDGDVSVPFRTNTGFHIIRRISHEGIESYDKAKEYIKNKVATDYRGVLSKRIHMQKLKDYYNYKQMSDLSEFVAIIDSSYIKKEWDPARAAKLKGVMFTLGDSSYLRENFVDFLYKTQRYDSDFPTFTDLVKAKFENEVNRFVYNYEKKNLEVKYPEYKYLVKEYHDGILLFNLTDSMIWSKSVADSAGLEAFYAANKDKYMWGERTHAIVYTCTDASILKKVQKTAKLRAKKDLTIEAIEALYTVEGNKKVTVEEHKYAKGENALLDKVALTSGFTPVEETDGKFVFAEILGKLPAMNKELEEARGLVTADYQNYLEEIWVKELRRKYPVEVNQAVLKTIQ